MDASYISGSGGVCILSLQSELALRLPKPYKTGWRSSIDDFTPEYEMLRWSKISALIPPTRTQEFLISVVEMIGY